jgi:hypothetical protein
MSIVLAFFNVSITQISGTAPSDGFVDYKSPRDYLVNNGSDLETGWPTNLTSSLAKTRAYLRWLTIIQQLETNISPVEVISLTNTGADQNTPPTILTFSVAYDRPDYLYTADELNLGATLTGAAAIKRFIARALTSSIYRNMLVLDPTLVANLSGQGAHYGESTQEVQVGSLTGSISTAESSITVTQIPNTWYS